MTVQGLLSAVLPPSDDFNQEEIHHGVRELSEAQGKTRIAGPSEPSLTAHYRSSAPVQLPAPIVRRMIWYVFLRRSGNDAAPDQSDFV